jgi:hypothetical protein
VQEKLFLVDAGACRLWSGEPGSLVGPWAAPAERPRRPPRVFVR